MVALPDRGLVPDEDAGAVEAVEQPVVQQVVRARHVRAQVLQLAHVGVHVGLGQRGAVARHVLVDRRAAQLDAAVVQVQVRVLDRDRAQAHGAADHLLHGAAVAQRDRARSRAAGARATRAPAAAPARVSANAAPLAASAGRAAALRAVVRPLGRAQPHLEARVDRAAVPSRSSTPSSSSAARQRRAGPAAPHRDMVPRSRRCARPTGSRRTGRTMPPQFHQPSGRSGFLRLSTTTVELVEAARPQPASVHVERACTDRCCGRCGGRSGTRWPRGGRSRSRSASGSRAASPGPVKLDPVAAHAAGVERRERARVEHARHLRRAARASPRPRRGRAACPAPRRLALRRGLLRRGRLRRCGRGGVGAHLPARRRAARSAAAPRTRRPGPPARPAVAVKKM